VNDLYKENYKPLKEIEDYKRWKDLLCSWIDRLKIVILAMDILVLSKAVYMFNTISIKIPITFITELKNQSQSSLGYTKNYKQPRQYWAKEQY
jgi:hypothetical protein